eukprot:TRINITY_DN74352_c0_g1_i1.p1 TRINITY_DN74352_c0_g1~~TRINITY_DN74352_c0_g1_i1.p1  ORF type:complete len:408 (+),score=81.76 TRINITY_DN74352_c0_g1_i1:50-1225(+)
MAFVGLPVGCRAKLYGATWLLILAVTGPTPFRAATAGQGRCPAGRPKRAGDGGAAGRAWNAIESECREKLEANRTLAAMRCLEGHFLQAREPGMRDGDWHTTLRKLRHDAEMFTWLEGKVKPEVKKLWRSIFLSARDQHKEKPDKVFEVSFQEQNDDRRLWQHSNNKAVYIDPAGKEVPKKTVRAKAAAFQAVEEAFYGEARGRAVVDRLLTDKALKKLKRFLQASTFYFYPRAGHHLLALLEDGLASPLLAQLSDGLRAAFPTLLGPLPLTGACAWKADNSKLATEDAGYPDLRERSGDAAVSVLIWLVPGHALNGSPGRVLELIPASADAEADAANIEPIRVGYAANRAVLWSPSRLTAVWKGPGWHTGFLQRGLHLLLNFGWAECAAA